MLVITRKVGEVFIIGENIAVQVLEVSGDKVKIGIEAPKDIKIMRKEIADTENMNIESQKTSFTLDKEKMKELSKKIKDKI